MWDVSFLAEFRIKRLYTNVRHRNPILLFYIHTSIFYSKLNAFFFLFKKAQSQNKSWRWIAHAMSCIYSWSVWKAFIKHTCTHSHAVLLSQKHSHMFTHSKRKKRTCVALQLYLSRAGLNEKKFRHHWERHLEYTVYTQTKRKENKDNSITFYVASRTMTKL